MFQHWHHKGNGRKSEFIADLNKYHSWYNAVLKDMTVRNETMDNDAAPLVHKLEDILKQIDITKNQLKQILDLKHDIDELKQFRIVNKRIKRAATHTGMYGCITCFISLCQHEILYNL